MNRNQRVVKLVTILSLLLILLTLFLIFVYSPYYSGFERELIYLSPDLSENRTVIRESFEVRGESEIKLVFELKDRSIRYDMVQFYTFLRDLKLQIWNDKEYFSIDIGDITHFQDQLAVVTIPIGRLSSRGKYHIYINSNYAVNPTYHIGVGIGVSSRFQPLGGNIRKFF